MVPKVPRPAPLLWPQVPLDIGLAPAPPSYIVLPWYVVVWQHGFIICVNEKYLVYELLYYHSSTYLLINGAINKNTRELETPFCTKQKHVKQNRPRDPHTYFQSMRLVPLSVVLGQTEPNKHGVRHFRFWGGSPQSNPPRGPYGENMD